MPQAMQQNKQARATGAMVTVTNAVDASKIRTETDEFGDEIIIVPSYTLPDDVVMNGGLYPADEIAKSYMTLEGTPAPLSHPTNANGEFVSASSEIGVHNFQCGVFNAGVKRENGRVYVEKRINKRIAAQSERGKRVLERVEAFMNGQGEPIHTSTGIYLDTDNLSQPMTNAAGEKYTWIARNMMFDHDCILLDEQGAATPDKGVGMMVNSELHTNLDNSESDKREALSMALREEYNQPDHYVWLVDYNDDMLIYELKEGYYQIGYTYSDSGAVSFVGQAVQVKRKTVWQAITNWFTSVFAQPNPTSYNQSQYGHGGRIITNIHEGNDMSFRQKLIDQLKANKVDLDYDNVTDEQLLDAVNAQSATTEAEERNVEIKVSGQVTEKEISEAVANALKPVTDKLAAVEAKLNANADAELNALREQAVEDLDLDSDDVKTMSANALRKLLSKQLPAYNVGGAFKPNSNPDQFSTELPE